MPVRPSTAGRRRWSRRRERPAKDGPGGGELRGFGGAGAGLGRRQFAGPVFLGQGWHLRVREGRDFGVRFPRRSVPQFRQAFLRDRRLGLLDFPVTGVVQLVPPARPPPPRPPPAPPP